MKLGAFSADLRDRVDKLIAEGADGGAVVLARAGGGRVTDDELHILRKLLSMLPDVAKALRAAVDAPTARAGEN